MHKHAQVCMAEVPLKASHLLTDSDTVKMTIAAGYESDR